MSNLRILPALISLFPLLLLSNGCTDCFETADGCIDSGLVPQPVDVVLLQ